MREVWTSQLKQKPAYTNNNPRLSTRVQHSRDVFHKLTSCDFFLFCCENKFKEKTYWFVFCVGVTLTGHVGLDSDLTKKKSQMKSLQAGALMLVLHCLMAEQIGKGNWNMGGFHSLTQTSVLQWPNSLMLDISSGLMVILILSFCKPKASRLLAASQGSFIICCSLFLLLFYLMP